MKNEHLLCPLERIKIKKQLNTNLRNPMLDSFATLTMRTTQEFPTVTPKGVETKYRASMEF
jgi:hypothetical protein